METKILEKLTSDWDSFYRSGQKFHTKPIEIDSLSDQGRLTLDLLKKFSQGSRVLEGGCGLGEWVLFFSNQGFRSYGIDVSLGALKNVEHKNKYLLGDLRRIPIKDNMFDVIFSYGAIEHFRETQDSIAEFYRILKPNGACLVTVPNPFTFHRILGRHILNITKSKALGYVGYEKAYTPKQIQRMFTCSGFADVQAGILHSCGGIFGCFWRAIPCIGKPIYQILENLALVIQKHQNTIGGASYAIGYKKINTEQY